MHFNATRWVPLLDFDVICGALPTFALHRQIERQAVSGPNSFSFEPIGPNSLRLLLSNLEDYSLPPGSIGELLTHQGRLTCQVSEKAKAFLSVLGKARESQNP